MLGELQSLLNSAPNLHIRLHDVYCPDGLDEVGEVDEVGGAIDANDGISVMSSWVNWVISGSVADAPSDSNEVRYWVHIRDVITAVKVLIDTDTNGTIDICGRRAWTQEMIMDELQGLWQRWLNTLAHSHTTASLSEVPSPAAVSYSGERRRPDLTPLHDALLAAGSGGWRPQTSMRVGLMECLAVSSE